MKCLCHDKFFSVFFFLPSVVIKGRVNWPHFFSSVIQLTCSEMFTKVTHLKTNLPFFYPF